MIAVTTVDAWWDARRSKRCAQYCGSRSIDYCGRGSRYIAIYGRASAPPHRTSSILWSHHRHHRRHRRVRSHCYKMQCVHIHTHRFPYTEIPHAKLSRMTYVGKWRSTIVSQNVSQRPHVRVSYFCPDALAAARLLHQFTQHEPKHRMQYYIHKCTDTYVYVAVAISTDLSIWCIRLRIHISTNLRLPAGTIINTRHSVFAIIIPTTCVRLRELYYTVIEQFCDSIQSKTMRCGLTDLYTCIAATLTCLHVDGLDTYWIPPMLWCYDTTNLCAKQQYAVYSHGSYWCRKH